MVSSSKLNLLWLQMVDFWHQDRPAYFLFIIFSNSTNFSLGYKAESAIIKQSAVDSLVYFVILNNELKTRVGEEHSTPVFYA